MSDQGHQKASGSLLFSLLLFVLSPRRSLYLSLTFALARPGIERIVPEGSGDTENLQILFFIFTILENRGTSRFFFEQREPPDRTPLEKLLSLHKSNWAKQRPRLEHTCSGLFFVVVAKIIRGFFFCHDE